MNKRIFSEFIQSHGSFILTAHETPDGDAIGSEIALYRYLSHLGKQTRIINADPCPKKYRYLDPENVIEVLSDETLLDREILGESGLFILDINDISNIGLIATRVLPHIAEHLIMDHHETTGNHQCSNVVEEDASSTCEILFKLFEALGYTPDLIAAKALFTGIIYDTGCFVYPKTTADTYRIARELIILGVIPNEIFNLVYESNSITSLMLQARVIGTLELFCNQQIAVQTMLKETIMETGASYEDADTIINMPLKSENIRISVFFKENTDGLLRCSLRSKGNINVSEIAQKFGGGGHKTAAGFKSKFPLLVIKEKILDTLANALKNSTDCD